MARLSKSNPLRVVCDDWKNCPETFGRITPGAERLLIMEAGWMQRYEAAEWLKPKPRIQPRRPYRPGGQNPAPVRHVIVFFPVGITCPRCGLHQFLEADKLQLKGLSERQLEIRPRTKDPSKSNGWRYLTSRVIGEREALQLLDNG
jgi:hypothetical protein